MKRSLASGACLVFAFGIASTISAQAARKQPDKPPASGSTAASPGAMGQPAPEMSKLKWMLGTWQCTGKAMASSMGPEHPTEAEVKGEETLGGMWVVFHYREKKTPQNPTPGMVDEYWTYDTAGKMWDRILVDSLGGWAKGFRCNARRFVEFIELRIRCFVAGLQPFAHYYVARRAGAHASASVVQPSLKRFGKIEDAPRQTVVAVGDFCRIDL